MFLLQYAGRQGLGGIRLKHLHGALYDDGPGIDLRGYEMDTGAMAGRAAGQGPGVRI